MMACRTVIDSPQASEASRVTLQPGVAVGDGVGCGVGEGVGSGVGLGVGVGRGSGSTWMVMVDIAARRSR